MRLVLLVFVAAIPILALSATITWQNYQLALAATAETAARLRESAISRHISAITGAEQMLQALAEVSDLVQADPQICHARLASLVALQAARYAGLAVAGADGRTRCSDVAAGSALGGPDNAADRKLFAMAAGHAGFVLGPIRGDPIGGLPMRGDGAGSPEIIPAAYPILANGHATGFVYAALRIDWFAREPAPPAQALQALWIADETGRVAMVTGTGALGLPATPLLLSLERGPGEANARSAGGAPYAYASARLQDGYSLIAAYPATVDRAAATDLLVRRLGQLGLLLLVGLAAVAVGTYLALVEPLAQLSQAVERWRRDGRFDASALHEPPTEVGRMAATFDEAILAIADHTARHRVAVAQQELLMREIHHRVKNNLQIVASLLNLQASRIRVPEARAEFASARDRVRALATLHRHLYMHGEVHTIDMPGFLTELCNQLFQAMGEVPGRRIGLAIEASPLQMSSDQAVPLSLIVTETVSNALKYAFPGGRTGRIGVKLAVDGDMADLTVEDDGVGIPAGRTETESGPRDGIGLTLIRGFARQLCATLTVHEDAGTLYTLRLPLNPAPHDTEAAA